MSAYVYLGVDTQPFTASTDGKALIDYSARLNCGRDAIAAVSVEVRRGPEPGRGEVVLMASDANGVLAIGDQDIETGHQLLVGDLDADTEYTARLMGRTDGVATISNPRIQFIELLAQRLFDLAHLIAEHGDGLRNWLLDGRQQQG